MGINSSGLSQSIAGAEHKHSEVGAVDYGMGGIQK